MNPKGELPIRSKVAIRENIVKALQYMTEGNRMALESLIEDLKNRAIYLDETIQQDVLIFAEQVQFQYDYDPWHKITPDIKKAADRLIEDLGWMLD